ncbi:MAG TPA: MFS transporter, partial [Thermoanaerobaculia bacterium]|nr:MFS transporter [Thermoanaerobaculia bacterium]
MSEPAPPAPPVEPTTAFAPPRSALARLAVLMATGCFDMMGMLMVLPLVPFYAKGMGASDTMVGVLAGSHAFAALMTAPWWGRLSDRFGRRPAILSGLVCSGIAFLVFAVT